MFYSVALRAYLQGDVEHGNADIWKEETPGKGNPKHIFILSYIGDSTKCFLSNSGAMSW